MLYQYLLTSWRNLKKYRLHSLLNIIGLAVGIAACLTIAAYVHYELTYDQNHPNAENTYRIALNRIYPTQSKKWAVTAPILAPTITDELPEVFNYTRVYPDYYILGREQEKMQKERLVGVDSGFFEIFHTPVLKGKITNDLFKRKDFVILTESATQKYFKDEDPIGQFLNVKFLEEKETMIVEAVIADPAPNSHFTYEVLYNLTAAKFPPFLMTYWGTWAFYSYISVHKDTDVVALKDKINAISEKNQGAGDDNFQSWLDAGNYYDYFLQPLTSIHLNSNLTAEFEANSTKSFVYFFAIVGVFILLMAIVNFVNMATARASQRVLEVGIRKSVGASRNDLVVQFLMESTIISVISLLIALPITQIFIPYFNQIINKSISMGLFFTPMGMTVLILSPLLIGLLSGFYPALYLSHFGPTSIFRRISLKTGKQQLRYALVTGQLIIAIILIAGTTTVFRQMHYFTNRPLGFDKDQVISVRSIPLSNEKLEVFVDKLKNMPGILDVALTGFPFDDIKEGIAVKNIESDEDWVNMTLLNSDENFLSTMGIQLVAGRNFRSDESDRNAIEFEKAIINETGVRALGWSPEEAIGKVITNNQDNITIIGVVADFNNQSLHEPVYPFIYSVNAFPDATTPAAVVKMQPRNMMETVALVEELWSEFIPDQLMVYDFMDQSMAQFYEAERLTGKLFVLFSSLAILISCLGLFGLMGFVVERRAKEIGIRKVMGAQVFQLVALLSRDYLRLVIISSLIAIPLAWWGMQKWLENFAYHVNNSIWTLLMAGFTVLIITWITVAYYAYRSASANPVNSLRKE